MALTIWVLAIAAIGAFVRVFWDLHDVFGGGSIRFQSTDPWVHLRQVEYLVRNFPIRLSFDPFGAYPGGQNVAVAPFLDYLAAALTFLLGPLIPHDAPARVVCAFLPPFLAAATTIAVYWVAQCIFNRAVGLLAALLLAITPGVHYAVSVLGCFDHHVLEVLLSTLAMGALLHAFRCTGRPVSDTPIPSAPRRLVQRISPSLLFGLLLGLYLLTWIGGSFLVLIIAAWTVGQILVDHWNERRVETMRMALIPGVLLALLIIVPFRNAFPLAGHQITTLTGLIVLTFALLTVSRLAVRFKISRYYFALSVTTFAAGGAIAIYKFNPALFDRVLRGMSPGGDPNPLGTIGEARSLFWSVRGSALAPAWHLFATGYPLAIVGLLIVGFRAVRRGRPGEVLLFTWSGAVLVAMMGQLRFGYYAAVNVAILASFACYQAIEHAGLIPSWLLARPPTSSDKPGPGARSQTIGRDTTGAKPPMTSRWQAVAMLVWVLALAVIPPAYALLKTAGSFSGPSAAWVETLKWMRAQTPEPLGKANSFFAIPNHFDDSGHFGYPDSAYGVMCWWDYGYWVTEIARRIPNANPTQRGAREAAQFYTATTETAALTVLRKMGSGYVIVDAALPMLATEGSKGPAGKFEALTLWAGRSIEPYYESFYQTNRAGQPEPVTLYFPDYFRSMCVRLFLYGGSAFEPVGPVQVARFGHETFGDGHSVKQLESLRSFPSYEAALNFLARPENADATLVSDDPTRSCIPLEALRHLTPAYDSGSKLAVPDKEISAVRVFSVDRAATKP